MRIASTSRAANLLTAPGQNWAMEMRWEAGIVKAPGACDRARAG